MKDIEIKTDIPGGQECAERIFKCTGQNFEPDIAKKLWPRILQHKWYLSEKLNRNVGIKVASIDLIENVEPMEKNPHNEERIRLLKDLGSQMIDRSVWDTISDTQPPKQIVNKRIILPLTETDLALKHGVISPKTIIFFGPPGTGKTHFVRAIAGILRWWYIEISPSTLLADGEDRMGANLKRLMEKVRNVDQTVVFIDEFEEIAASRDHASRIDKSITNEFLKQVPLLKKQGGRMLLICATNYIHLLDAALLRPGRFDCVIPVGGLDDQGRRTIFDYYLSSTNLGKIDVERIISMIPLFTPADIEYLFQKVRQYSFEKEYTKKEDYRVTTETFMEIIPKVRPTLTNKIIEEFERDCNRYTRY